MDEIRWSYRRRSSFLQKSRAVGGSVTQGRSRYAPLPRAIIVLTLRGDDRASGVGYESAQKFLAEPRSTERGRAAPATSGLIMQRKPSAV